MAQTELTRLIQGARAGDRQAQEELLAGIQNRVYYHCKKMLKRDSDAQDAAQDVLITVLTSLDKLREPAAFYGWVNGITANRCKHLLTRGGREWQIPETEDGDSMLDDLEDLDQQAVPDAVLDNKETQRLMMELIDALPPEQRMSVLFYYYDEMSVKEIAQAMETTEGTVKSRLNYARKSIKAGVEDLERRGTKLYSIAPLPLLLVLFLRKDASQSGMTAAQSAQVTSAVLSAVRPGTAGTAAASAKAGAAGGTAAKAGIAVSTKVVGGVLAAVAAMGIVFGAAQLMKPDEPPRLEDEPPAQSVELPRPEPEPEDEGPSPELLALLDSIVYYGDKEQCRLTPEQAAAFAQVIRREADPAQAEVRWTGSAQGTGTFVRAALFDVGDGTPALFFGAGTDNSAPGLEDYWLDAGTTSIWEYRDGQAVPYAPEGQAPGERWGRTLVLRDGNLFVGGWSGDRTSYQGEVYPLLGGTIPTAPQTSAEVGSLVEANYERYYIVDGAEAGENEFTAWQDRWDNGNELCGHHWDGGVGGSFSGFGDGAATAEALTQYAAGTAALGGESTPQTGAPAAQAYAQAYAQKIRELTVIDPNLTFDLIYIDGDDVPELLVNRIDTDMDWSYISLYTFAGDTLYVLQEDLLIGIRDYLGYYPRENLVEYSGADLNMNQWESGVAYYQINGAHQWEEAPASTGPSAEIQYLRGVLTGTEILAQLEQ